MRTMRLATRLSSPRAGRAARDVARTAVWCFPLCSFGSFLWVAGVTAVVLGTSSPALARPKEPRSIGIDRTWDVLAAPGRGEDARAALHEAGLALGDWEIHLAGVPIDGPLLVSIAKRAPEEPFLRTVREALRRPIDLADFLRFLDDVLHAGENGRRGELVWITPGRARKVGILVHPDDVFEEKPRRYPAGRTTISIDRPRPQVDLPQAKDGEPPGPRWTMRYRNPSTDSGKLAALERAGSASLAARVEDLVAQLRDEGAEVYLNSTVRNRARGYLMWGAFVISRAPDAAELGRVRDEVERANEEWGLGVPIEWPHPDGWRATREAAREMADTYEVVYATRQGARSSNHYTGRAFDITAVGLPRRLRLRAPDGAIADFDLSRADHTRDLNLSLDLIAWVEEHFGLAKLRSDYPHWNDAP